MKRFIDWLFRVHHTDITHPPAGVGWVRYDTDTEHGWGRYDGVFAQWKPDTKETTA